MYGELAAHEMHSPSWHPENLKLPRAEILRWVTKSKSYLEKSKSYEVGKIQKLFR